MGYTHLFSLRASSNPSSLAFAAARNENSLRLPTTEKKKQEKHFFVSHTEICAAVFTVFATMTTEFQHETVLGFWIVQEHALRHKAGRTGRQTEGLSRHEWGFSGFCLH